MPENDGEMIFPEHPEGEVVEEAVARRPRKRVRISLKALPDLPSREVVAKLCIDAYRLALDSEKSYKQKDGEVVAYKSPDVRGACEALKLLSNLCGYLDKAPKSLEDISNDAQKKLAEVSKEAQELASQEEEELSADSVLNKLRSKQAKEEYPDDERNDE